MRTRTRIALVLLAGQGLGRGAQAVYGILMVRELSARGYGDFAYVLAMSGVCVVIADMGFSRVMVRDLAREDDARSLVGEMLRARSLGVLGVTAAFTVLAVAGGLPDAPTLGLAAAAFLLSEAFVFGSESAAVGIELPARFAVVHLVAGAAVGVAAELAAASAVKLAAHRVLWRGGRQRPFCELPVRRWARESAPFFRWRSWPRRITARGSWCCTPPASRFRRRR